MIRAVGGWTGTGPIAYSSATAEHGRGAHRRASAWARPVRECTDPPPRAQPDDTVREAAKRMAEACCGSILVCDGEKLLGIFPSATCWCVVAAGLEPPKTRIGDVTADPDTIEGSRPSSRPSGAWTSSATGTCR